MKKQIVLAAGGTGGHMAPADSVKEYLLAAGQNIHVITDTRGARYDNLLQGCPRCILPSTSHMQGGLIGKAKAALSLGKSFFYARKYLKKQKADLVVGFGGYPSLPAVLAAKSLGLPYVLHEQNAVLGRVNRWTASKAAFLALSYEDTKQVASDVKCIVTGNPVRQSLIDANFTAYKAPLKGQDFHILSIGGSQGARILSDVIGPALAGLPDDIKKSVKVTQQARPEDLQRVSRFYAEQQISADVAPYFHNIPEKLAAAHLVICRAGASTIAEVSAMQRPAIYVPLKIAADDHQRRNAETIAQSGAGWMFLEEDFTADALREKILKFCENPKQLQAASDVLKQCNGQQAGQKLAGHILRLLGFEYEKEKKADNKNLKETEDASESASWAVIETLLKACET